MRLRIRFCSAVACVVSLLPFVTHVYAQPAKLLPADGEASDFFGMSVALSADGRYAVVGATGDDDGGSESGAAYVFHFDGSGWTEQAKLRSPMGSAADYFGGSVAVSGDGSVVLVGSSVEDTTGAVHVYERSGTSWTHGARIVPVGAVNHDRFGVAVAIAADGSRAIIGATGVDGADTWSGAAYVFARTGSGWQEEAVLRDPDPTSQQFFGRAVSLSDDGRFAVIGAPSIGGDDRSFVFYREGISWMQQARLEPTWAPSGTLFGLSVSISGDGRYALIGASAESEDGSFSGGAYVFSRSGTAWSLDERLMASDAEPEDRFGVSVALNADASVALVGANESGLGTGIGSAYLLRRSGAQWLEYAKLETADGEPNDYFGVSVALSGVGDRALIGAHGEDDLGSSSGSAHVLSRPADPVRDLPYVVTLGSAGFDSGTDVGIDGYGNAYFIGEFDGAFDFDPGADVASMTSSRRDVYVVSYDASGAHRFGFQIGNAFAASESAGGIDVDHAGRFVITGGLPFHGVDFDPDPTIEALREGAFFVAGYESDGTLGFAIAPPAADAASAAEGNDVAIGRRRDVYVVGSFTGTIDFDPAPPTGAKTGTTASPSSVLTSAGGWDGFIAGYSSRGAFRFAIPLGGTETDEATAIAVDRSENVFVTGDFRGTVPFDPTDANGNGNLEQRTSGVVRSAYLAGYSSDGTFRFAHVFGDDADAEAVSVDTAGNVYVAGTFRGTVRFDPGDTDADGDLVERTERAGGTAFLACYGGDGTYRFVNVLRGRSTARSLATRRDGVTFLSGSFGATVDFDPGPGVFELQGRGGLDVFVASYDSNGALVGAFGLDGDGLDAGNGIAADRVGNVILTGDFTGNTDFDPGPGFEWRAGGGQTDIFMAKFPPMRTTVSSSGTPEIPSIEILSPAHPNPFDTQTRLRLTVPAQQRVQVVVYDVLGRRIEVLSNTRADPHLPLEIEWRPRGAAPGVYVVRAEGETFSETQTVVLVR